LPLLAFLLCLVVIFTGCSDNVKVKGKVTLTDGTPLALGEVIFERDTFSARGDIKSDGTYVMGTLKENDGVPKGEYVVYIRGATSVGESGQVRSLGGGGQSNMISIASMIPIIAKEYTSASTSPLRCNVEKSMVYDIEVPPSNAP